MQIIHKGCYEGATASAAEHRDLADHGFVAVTHGGSGPEGSGELRRHGLISWLGLRRINWSRISAAVGLVLLLLAGFVLHRLLAEVTWGEVSIAFAHTPARDLVGASLATALSYAALVGYDLLALRQVGARAVGFGLTALISFVSNAFTFTLGFGLLSGGAVRLRLYTAAGVPVSNIIAVGVLCTLTFWLGLAGLTGATLVLAPDVVTLIDGLHPYSNVVVGLGLLSAVAAYVIWTGIRTRHLALGGWSISLPSWRTNLVALVLGLLDIIGAAVALWLLLPNGPSGEPVGFMAFLAIFILATVLGVASQAPGGLGVFEATIILALPSLPTAELIASLLLFRAIYYMAPFALALLLLAGGEVRERSEALKEVARASSRSARHIGGIVAGLIPHASALAAFAGGVVLIVSGATPADQDRLAVLRHVVPLPFVETSHLLASVVGVVLLVLATGLARRLHTAWRGSVALLAAGAVFSMAKGIDYEEAFVCLAGLTFLLLAHGQFYRRAELFEKPLSARWAALAVLVVAASIWLGFFAYSHVEYTPELWWEFAYRGDAPRFLRATLAVCTTLIGVAVYAFVHRLPGSDPAPTAGDLARVRAAVAASSRVDAQLALLGDKDFLFAGGADDGFVMYGVQGRSFVAMGDPVARSEETVSELIWRFKELADARDGTPVFYQITRDHLPLYVEAGLALLKIGEEAWVDLDRFTLQGGQGRKLRQSKSRAENGGASFELVPAGPPVEAILPELRAVSHAWLGEKGREKGFSLGFWTDAYMRRCDQAVVRHAGRIVAFVNVWRSADCNEFSIDLMRQAPDAPGGVMDLLFIGLMNRAKEEGFRWFGLGMAPLSGLPRHHLASLWSRLGALMYRRGDRFYNFEGLRAFKEKFRPEWRPRYLAYPGALGLPQILLDITVLTATSPQRAAPGPAETDGPRPGIIRTAIS